MLFGFIGDMLMGLGMLTLMFFGGVGGLVYLAAKNGLLKEFLPKPDEKKPPVQQ